VWVKPITNHTALYITDSWLGKIKSSLIPHYCPVTNLDHALERRIMRQPEFSIHR